MVLKQAYSRLKYNNINFSKDVFQLNTMELIVQYPVQISTVNTATYIRASARAVNLGTNVLTVKQVNCLLILNINSPFVLLILIEMQETTV